MNTPIIIVIFVIISTSALPRVNYPLLEQLLGLADINSRIYQAFLKRIGLSTDPTDIKTQGTRDETYDFIIVGSGSAGSVIANRLSSNPNWKVLLLEAGRVENAVSQIPVLAPALQFTEYNWNYRMEYQDGFAMGLENQRLPWPRGRALGGSTVINYMIYTRGSPVDFERWAGQGNPGWSYEQVFPYFLRSENSTLTDGDPRFHSSDGEWSVANPYQSPLLGAFIDGGREMGYDFLDYTGPQQIGFSSVKANIIEGRRHSVAMAFLRPIKHRKNLHIRTSAYVTKVLINPQTRIAYGVEYNLKGHHRKAYATKEVILSAGTFNSPQLLMLSGIGPREHLTDLGIPVLEDLPVGKNLQDHITYVGLTFTVEKNVSLNIMRGLSTESLRGYIEYGVGPITSLGGVEGLAYIQALDKSIPGYPDIELIFVGGALNSDYGLINRRAMGITDQVYNTIWKPIHDVDTWTIFPMLLHPESTGFLKLRSKNPFDYPIFVGNYLTDPQRKDVRTMIASIRFIQNLSRTNAFRGFGTREHKIPVPGCQHYQFDSDGYWECAIRSLSITLHHQVGTNRMGPSYDPKAVVDPELRVYGVGGLRVADCSVIPFAITAHTSAPAVMVGEKASDFIVQSWSE